MERWQDTAARIVGALGITLSPEQSDIFYDDARIKVVCGGEGGSKSFLGSLTAVCRSFHDALAAEEQNEAFGELYWVVGADFEDARKEFGDKGEDNFIVGWMSQLGDYDEDRSSVPTHKNQPCVLTTRRYHQRFETISGYDPLKLGREEPTGLIGCEVSRWEREVWDRCVGRLARKAPNSWGFFSGSPESWTGSDWFGDVIRLGISANPLGIRSYSLPSWANLHIYPGGREDPAILQLEASMSADRFMRRHGGILTAPANAVLPEFSVSVHVKPVAMLNVPVHLFVDPGSYIYSVLAIQFADDEVHIIDELYCHQWTHAAIIEAASNRPWWRLVGRGEHVMDIAGTQKQGALPPPVDAWRTDTGLHFATQYIKVDDSVERLRSVLSVNQATGRPRLIIDPSCKGIICEMGGGPAPAPGIKVWRNVGGRPERANDHSCKALAYGLIHHFGTRRPTTTSYDYGEDDGSELVSSYLTERRNPDPFERLLAR